MNDRQISGLFLAIKALLIAGLLYVGVGAVITPFSSGAGGAPSATSAQERALTAIGGSREAEMPADYSLIVANDIFAGADRPTASPEFSAGPRIDNSMRAAEELGLRLVGAIAGGRAASRAVIENTKTKQTSPYKIGDSVASATIESIEADKVILLHNGQQCVLRMQSGALAPVLPEPPLKETPVVQVDQPTPRSSRFGYVEDLFRQATFEPYVQDGQTEGLKITGLEKIPMAKAIGLRNGDVVQSVNGQRLISKQKAVQVLKKARTQSQMNMQLLRDGRTKDLSIDL